MPRDALQTPCTSRGIADTQGCRTDGSNVGQSPKSSEHMHDKFESIAVVRVQVILLSWIIEKGEERSHGLIQ